MFKICNEDFKLARKSNFKPFYRSLNSEVYAADVVTVCRKGWMSSHSSNNGGVGEKSVTLLVPE